MSGDTPTTPSAEGSGRNASSPAQASSISYLWQGATLAEEHRTSGSSSEISRWHFEPGTFNPVAKEMRQQGAGAEKAGEPRFYPIVTDHLGTPKELFDREGNCLWQAEHELWGKAAITAKKVDDYQPIVDCSLRFQNQWEDEESGLYYNLHRYYDPDSAQYLSPDPIGLEGGLRTHGYVHDPMQWVDPLGLAGCPKAILAWQDTPDIMNPVYLLEHQNHQPLPEKILLALATMYIL
jgi:RHS repeat-associated protein